MNTTFHHFVHLHSLHLLIEGNSHQRDSHHGVISDHFPIVSFSSFGILQSPKMICCTCFRDLVDQRSSKFPPRFYIYAPTFLVSCAAPSLAFLMLSCRRCLILLWTMKLQSRNYSVCQLNSSQLTPSFLSRVSGSRTWPSPSFRLFLSLFNFRFFFVRMAVVR